jgi:stress-induced morphogen
VFEKKMMLARHRLVNTALKDEISRLHAFSQNSYTPEEWDAQQAKSAS